MTSFNHMRRNVLRFASNVTKGYSSTQRKVAEATSNDVGVSSDAQMNEIAQLTYNEDDFVEIVEMLVQGLSNKGKCWRRTYNSLTLINYCRSAGSENVAIYFLDNIYIIKALREFEFVDEHGEDHGQTVRQWAADIVNLLRDDGRLRRERQSHAPKRFRTVSGPKNYDDDDSDCATDPFSDDASTPSVSFLASIHVSTSNHFVAAKARGLQGHSRDLTTLETYGNSGLLPDLSGFDRSQPWSILLDTLLNSVKNLLSCGFSMSYLLSRLPSHLTVTEGAHPERPSERIADILAFCISAVLRGALTVHEHRVELLALQQDEAQIMLCVIQNVLERFEGTDSPLTGADNEHPGQTRRRLLRLLAKLAETSKQLPQSLFVTGVELQSRDAIARGGFADVFLGTSGGMAVALKRLRINAPISQKSAINRGIYREALILMNLKHRFLLRFLGVNTEVFEKNGLCCMVMPWMARGNIIVYLTEDRGALERRERLVAEMAEGLSYLHSSGIIHGDVRGSNVFVSQERHVQLAGFGLAAIHDVSNRGLRSATSGAGSKRWMAPELHDPGRFGLEHFEYTTATDVYAFASTILEIYTFLVPFSDIQNETAAAMRIMEGVRPARPSAAQCSGQGIPENIWRTVEECWRQDRASRPSMGRVCASMPLAFP